MDSLVLQMKYLDDDGEAVGFPLSFVVEMALQYLEYCCLCLLCIVGLLDDVHLQLLYEFFFQWTQ